MHKKTLLIILQLVVVSWIYSQTAIENRIGIGQNFVKETYLEIGTTVAKDYKDWDFLLGLNFQAGENIGTSLHSILITSQYQLPTKLPLNAVFVYMYHPHAGKLMSENTFALNISYLPAHFDIEIGTYLRLLHSKSQSSETVAEYFHLLYQINAYVFPKNYTYNAMFSLRSYDTFEIEQTGNPMYIGRLLYQPKDNMYFVEACIKPSGLFNVHINPFHFLARGGIVWKL